jgi:hypothetical protein
MKSLITLFAVFTALSFLTQTEITAQPFIEDLTTSINGTIINKGIGSGSKAYSENGIYSYNYNIGPVTDEYRELLNVRFYENDNLLFTLHEVPGSDVEISNSGYVLFYDHSKHFKGELRIHFYSKTGSHLFTKTFLDADQFTFSNSGKSFGVMDASQLNIIHLQTGEVEDYEKGHRFHISEDDELVAVADQTGIKIYKKGVLVRSLRVNLNYLRKIKISASDDLVSVLDKRNILVYKISTGKLLFEKSLSGNLSFRDLRIHDGKIITGIHNKRKDYSGGLLQVYDLGGNIVYETAGNQKTLSERQIVFTPGETGSGYDPIPWPFAPFDSTRTVWNHYEQHMGNGGGDWSYLHQGLDLITPIGEPTYSVIDGYIKLVLTIGGASYWRVAVSDTQVAGFSDGWLSAHLIENTIQFDVGDTVQVHDYLGDIIQWGGNWGHIHFVEIKDSGLVWFYNDNEWGINFNPLLALQPLNDTTAPVIESVFENSKFGFCTNETSDYLTPDSLFGDIDIIVKVVDYVDDSEWQQPAFRTYYWIQNVESGDTIQTRTMGHILNHTYPFYDGSNYEPYAVVMYKRDNILPTSSWNDTERDYYHILTNSDGDSLLNLNERFLSFITSLYTDGVYRIFVEVFDEAGNSTIDSMNVYFNNGNTSDINTDKIFPTEYSLYQNYPNPFNPSTTIRYSIPQSGNVRLVVYDLLGREVKKLVDDYKQSGTYEISFNASLLASGVYFYQIRAVNYVETKKMVLLK